MAALLENARFQRILFPTDLSEEAPDGFAVCVKLAARQGGRITVVHVHDDAGPVDWRALPTVRSLLERWALLPAGAAVGDYKTLGMQVDIAERRGSNAVREVVDDFGWRHWDLLVVGSRPRDPVERWTWPSVSEAMARKLGVSTLFVPKGRSLVDAETGRALIRKVVIPVEKLETQRAINHLVQFARALAVERAEGILVHVGAREETPDLALPAHWAWATEHRSGSVVDEIVAVAGQHGADLIAMSTHGHDSVGDALMGSITERVLHHAPCPVLAIREP